MTQPRNLYALFVGINYYEAITGLDGCVNDVNAMRDYLKAQPDLNLIEHVLLSPDKSSDSPRPTKAAIVEAIQNHLGQAGSEDIVLFYFAGHGVQERTVVPAFAKAEPRALLEALVCYDSRFSPENPATHTCLADKELRWLFSSLSATKNPHILIITDCCHSGDIMREAKTTEVHKKRLGTEKSIPPRAWDGFIFHNDISQADANQKSLSEILPLGDYVHFAACRDAEVAWEGEYAPGKPGGSFTVNLLKILRRGGRNISYHDLSRRIANYMRNMNAAYLQRPQVFAGSDRLTALYGLFLNGEVSPSTKLANITGNGTLGWVLDMGAIHGLIPGDIGKAVRVFDNNDVSKPPLGEVKIKKIMPGYALVDDPGHILSAKKLSYFAEVECFAESPVTVFLKGEEAGLSFLRKALGNEESVHTHNPVQIIDNEKIADYCLVAEDDLYSITHSNEYRPVVAHLSGFDMPNARKVAEYCKHISRWKYIKALNNPLTEINKEGRKKMVELEIFALGKDEVEYKLDLRESQKLNLLHIASNGARCGRIKIRVVNHSSQALYVSLLYLPMSFGVYNTLLPQRGLWLEGGESVWAGEGDFIDLQLEQYIYDFRWPGAWEYLKLIISASEFSTEELTLAELPLPEKNRGHALRGSFQFRDAEYRAKEDDWTAEGYELFIKNPDEFDPTPDIY
ncbi:MAG: caspase family protein [Bacteroidia bacterium]